MNHLDDQLKELQNMPREDNTRMKTYHQAKAQLYEQEQPKRSFSITTYIGIPALLLSTLFIGFLLAYEWIGGSTTQSPTEQQPLFINGQITEAHLAHAETNDQFRLLENEAVEGMIVIDDQSFLSSLGEKLNEELQITEINPGFPSLELLLFLENGESVPLQVVEQDNNTYVSIYGEEAVYETDIQLGGDLINFFIEQEVNHDVHAQEYATVEEALANFPYDIMVPSQEVVPGNLSLNNVMITTVNGDPVALETSYLNETGSEHFHFIAIKVLDFTYEKNVVEPEWETETYNSMEFRFAVDDDSIIVQWEEANFEYSLFSNLVEKEALYEIAHSIYENPGVESSLSLQEQLEGTAQEIHGLLEDLQWEAVAEYVHPTIGLAFSGYANLGEDDTTFTQDEVTELGSNTTEYDWFTDNADRTFTMTANEYVQDYLFKHYGNDAYIPEYSVIHYNESDVGGGGIINTIHDVYLEGIFVELYSPPPSMEEEMLYQAIRYVFVEQDEDWVLVGIVRVVHNP